MGVQNDASDKYDEAVKHLQEAYKCMLDVIHPGTHGHSELSEVYIDKAQNATIEIRKLLKTL